MAILDVLVIISGHIDFLFTLSVQYTMASGLKKKVCYANSLLIDVIHNKYDQISTNSIFFSSAVQLRSFPSTRKSDKVTLNLKFQ